VKIGISGITGITDDWTASGTAMVVAVARTVVVVRL
jgi:hypothetical protein